MLKWKGGKPTTHFTVGAKKLTDAHDAHDAHIVMQFLLCFDSFSRQHLRRSTGTLQHNDGEGCQRVGKKTLYVSHQLTHLLTTRKGRRGDAMHEMRWRDPTPQTGNAIGEMVFEIIEKDTNDACCRNVEEIEQCSRTRQRKSSLGLPVPLCEECTNPRVQEGSRRNSRSKALCCNNVFGKTGRKLLMPSKSNRSIMILVWVCLGEAQYERQIKGPDYPDQNEEDDGPVF